MPDRIQPRTLKGFRDYLPESMIPREQIIETARRVYRSYGFNPIDTPALEFEEILTGKSAGTGDSPSAAGDESDRQMFRFEDHGGRRVALRFDLTIPLARFAAQHISDLGTPFKRYHIATVWRGEKPQRGRYREFMQCDFDTIGTKSVAADIETGLVIHDLLEAIGFSSFTICINNRLVLNGLLERIGLEDQSTSVLRSLDKLAKIGREKVIEEMVKTSTASTDQAEQVLKMAELCGSRDETLKELRSLVAGSQSGEEGVDRLADVLSGIEAAGLPPDRFKLDVSIARGLDYYTSTVFETYLDKLPSIGSVCSGGRYDNLAELYTKQELPGIGASLGLDRLLAAMEELEMLQHVRTPAAVMIAYFAAGQLNRYLHLARQVRSAGIGVELFPEPKKLGQQLKYADRRGFRIALIAGEDELAKGECQVKDLKSGESEAISTSASADPLISAIRRILANE